MVCFPISKNDGSSKPFCHGDFFRERIMFCDDMIKEFHDMIVMELFFVDEHSGGCYTAHRLNGWQAFCVCAYRWSWVYVLKVLPECLSFRLICSADAALQVYSDV